MSDDRKDEAILLREYLETPQSGMGPEDPRVIDRTSVVRCRG